MTINGAQAPTLIMLVGIPASGKSTKSAEYLNKGYLVLHSDEIRQGIMGDGAEYPTDQAEITRLNKAVFELIKVQALAALKGGQSVVVDSTSLGRKKRMAFLRNLGKTPCVKRCVLFITPREVCISRNAKRSGIKRVPDEAMEKMLRSFECPHYCEGWDVIEPVVDDTEYRFPFEKTKSLAQDNPHHTLTLYGHLAAAAEYAKAQGFSPRIQHLAYYHDIGKLYTKAFKNKRGEPTEFAHFYEHENYSAYLYLTEMCCGKVIDSEGFKEILYNTSLINCHMRPLNLWRDSSRAKEKDIALFGSRFISDLEQLHEADVAAH